MKEVVFHYVKKCTLVVANKTTLLHGKDNTFRSGHPEVAERFDQIPGKKARHGQTCQGFQHMEPSGEHDILSVLPMDGTHHNTAVRCPQAAGYIQMALLEPRCIT